MDEPITHRGFQSAIERIDRIFCFLDFVCLIVALVIIIEPRFVGSSVITVICVFITFEIGFIHASLILFTACALWAIGV